MSSRDIGDAFHFPARECDVFETRRRYTISGARKLSLTASKQSDRLAVCALASAVLSANSSVTELRSYIVSSQWHTWAAGVCGHHSRASHLLETSESVLSVAQSLVSVRVLEIQYATPCEQIVGRFVANSSERLRFSDAFSNPPINAQC